MGLIPSVTSVFMDIIFTAAEAYSFVPSLSSLRIQTWSQIYSKGKAKQVEQELDLFWKQAQREYAWLPPLPHLS